LSTPYFYCENCGQNVSSSLDICPGCGQEFSSVRCPSCGFTGEAPLFKIKCPQCGYSGIQNTSSYKKTDLIKPGKNRKQLPVWLYSALIGIMVVVIFGLIRIYFLL